MTERKRSVDLRWHFFCYMSFSILTNPLHQPLKNDKFVIPKSRYDSVDLYISQDWINRPEYNDTVAPYDLPIYDRLREHGE